METRQLPPRTQIKIWKLIMNDMRMSQIEQSEIVAISEDRQKLINLVESEKCEPYTDEGWGKSFKKGGKLEWKNSFHHRGDYLDTSFRHGIIEEWVDDEIFHNQVKTDERYIFANN